MRTVFEHIDRARAQPHHIRKQLVFGLAGLATGIIGVLWLSVSVTTGAFAIQGDGFAQAAGVTPTEATSSMPAASSAVAGVAAAGSAQAQAPAHIEVIPPDQTPGGGSQSEQTIIPF